jgi:GGDEF domain-containing protein
VGGRERDRIWRAAPQGVADSVEINYQRPTGESLRLQRDYVPLEDGLTACYFQDVTKFHKTLLSLSRIANEEAHDDADRYRTVLAALGTEVFIHAPDTEICQANPQARELLGIQDVDGLKEVNDTQGDSVGDELPIEVAKTTAENVSGEDFAARIGGDDFLVLLTPTEAREAE